MHVAGGWVQDRRWRCLLPTGGNIRVECQVPPHDKEPRYKLWTWDEMFRREKKSQPAGRPVICPNPVNVQEVSLKSVENVGQWRMPAGVTGQVKFPVVQGEKKKKVRYLEEER